MFRAIGYRNELDGSEHIAIVKGQPERATGPVLVRVHSECLTGDAFGSLRCDCRPQLEAALRMIEAAGEGVVVYLRQEGRGIGLVNKLRAYSLQDTGLDTVEANERLGFPADLRNYGVGAQILSDLGVHRLRLITNNPRKIAGLGGYGLQVEDRVPLVMDPGAHNAAYLSAKRTKLGHLMGQGPSCPVGGPSALVAWHGPIETEAALSLGEQLAALAADHGLQCQNEQDPRLLALLNQPQLALLLSTASTASTEASPLTSQTDLGLQHCLQRLARRPETVSVSLVLSPDPQHLNHPSASLLLEERQLHELRHQERLSLRPDPGLLIRWQA
jgi:3,4-dihydroxy 2-butanone 4-phosphate synthase/GTP cyclohydrolase II